MNRDNLVEFMSKRGLLRVGSLSDKRAIPAMGVVAEHSELPTRGAQHVTRNTTWEAFVRAIRPTFLCPSPNPKYTRKTIVLTDHSMREEFNRSETWLHWETFSPKCATPDDVGEIRHRTSHAAEFWHCFLHNCCALARY